MNVQVDDGVRQAVRGQVLLPGDAGFAEASTPWNMAVAQRPVAVVHARDAADVRDLVAFAGRNGLVVSAQPGGHGATRAVDGTILVRTGALDELWIDAEEGVARVGAGVKWGTLVAALAGTDRIALAGSNPDVCVTGYLLGGGLSWFGRRYGLAAHCVRAVELVDGTGQLRWVTDQTDPELMWAMRGGGGEFGIVTRLEISLPAEPELHGGKFTFPVAEAAAVLGAFAEVTAQAPDGLTCWAWIAHLPDLPDVPAEVRGQSFVGVDVTWLGSADEGRALVAPLRAAAPLLADTFGPISIDRLGEVAAEPTEPMPSLDWATPVGGLDPATIDRIVATAADRERTMLTLVQLRHLQGALASPAAVPAVADHLQAPYLAFAFGIPAVPELVEPIRASLDELAAACGPGPGQLPLTFVASGVPVSAAFDDDSLARLRAVKSRVDPASIIRGNHPLT